MYCAGSAEHKKRVNRNYSKACIVLHVDTHSHAVTHFNRHVTIGIETIFF